MHSSAKDLRGPINKAFQLNMDDRDDIIAKIPNRNIGRQHFTTVSEVAATIDFVWPSFFSTTSSFHASVLTLLAKECSECAYSESARIEFSSIRKLSRSISS